MPYPVQWHLSRLQNIKLQRQSLDSAERQIHKELETSALELINSVCRNRMTTFEVTAKKDPFATWFELNVGIDLPDSITDEQAVQIWLDIRNAMDDLDVVYVDVRGKDPYRSDDKQHEHYPNDLSHSIYCVLAVL